MSRMPVCQTSILSILPILFVYPSRGSAAAYEVFGETLPKLLEELNERLAA